MIYYYNCDAVYKTTFERGTLTLPHHFCAEKRLTITLLQGIVVANKNRGYEHQIYRQPRQKKKTYEREKTLTALALQKNHL